MSPTIWATTTSGSRAAKTSPLRIWTNSRRKACAARAATFRIRFAAPPALDCWRGRYQQRFGHETNPEWLPQSTNAGFPISQITVADLLRKQGYLTGLVGKWHLGAHPQFHPLKRGFDECFAVLGGGHGYMPSRRGKDEYNSGLDRNGTGAPHTSYLTDQFGDEASDFVGRHKGKHWFLYLAFNAPHTPLQAPKGATDKLTHITNPKRRTYAAMVQIMDANIGKVLAQLDATQQRENTLVFFFSDNGGPLERNPANTWTDNAPLRGGKTDFYEGGARVPFLISWPAKLKPAVYAQPVISLDVMATGMDPFTGQGLALCAQPDVACAVGITSPAPGSEIAWAADLPMSPVRFEGIGGSGIYTFSLCGGILPTGLHLDAATGWLAGTSAVSGTFDFTVRIDGQPRPVQRGRLQLGPV
ncbi:MAG: sulfatase-like hydrolase/transferase, partial [Rhodobacteraceae bacterium]|nr:sulfatase-like hydrolase/transferase [Paracoccaceae bacterium]